MVNKLIFFGILIFLAFNSPKLKASDWQKTVELKGTWHFTIGDNPDWAYPSANINDWDQIPVPGEWERYYEGYNGFAWYRKSFDFKVQPESGELVVFLGYIDDVDEVFINGVKIGQSGKFPPDFQTAYNVERRYLIPKSLLKPVNNIIAVRVFDESKPGGIIRGGKIGIYYEAEEALLLYNLSGNWKFTTQSIKNIHSPQFDDRKLGELYVPATWDSQGYQEYDGYGWYRKKFTLPDNFPLKNLFLVLGQIDDIDKVYLNGKLIGSTKNLEAYHEVDINDAYRLYRSYRIPEGVLKKQNLLSVEVFDKYGEGGIYSGPIGIMTEENRNKFMNNHRVEKSKNPIKVILEYLFGSYE